MRSVSPRQLTSTLGAYGHLGENLTTQAIINLAERGSLVREHQSAFQLVFQDAVFGGQIFVPGQQLLTHRPCDVGQDARLIHNAPFARSPYRNASGAPMLAVHN